MMRLYYTLAFVIGGFIGLLVAWWTAYEASLLWLVPAIICVLMPTESFHLLFPKAFVPTDALGAPGLPVADARFLVLTFIWNGLIACALLLVSRHYFASRGLKTYDRNALRDDY